MRDGADALKISWISGVTAARPGDVMITLSGLRVLILNDGGHSMEKVEFVGSLTDLSISRRPDDDGDDDYCPSDSGRAMVACCSPGLD
jgi:hypothetical protein